MTILAYIADKFAPVFGFGLFLLLGSFAIATPGKLDSSVPTVKEPQVLKILRTIPHSGYSEGLDFQGGYLWNALPKSLVKIDPKDGVILASYVPATEYSESLKWVKGKLWNVSFKDNGIYEGVLKKEKIEFTRKGSVPEIFAWGLEFDGKSLIVTGNYSNKLYFLNPKTIEVERTIEVEVTDLEDLAWDGTQIWISSFTKLPGTIFSVDPKTGKVSGYYRLPEVSECPVIDGVAVDGDALWITGKECVKLYRVEKPRSKSSSKIGSKSSR